MIGRCYVTDREHKGTSIKKYVDDTYNTESVIEDNTINMSKVLKKDDTFFGEDLNRYNYFELYKYFEEKGYTCR